MKFLKEHTSLFLIKLFSFNSIGVVLRSFLGLISQKMIAVFLGPDGIALVGNLRNILNLFSLGSTLGIDQGVLKFQSEFENNPSTLEKLYKTSRAYALLGSVLVFGVLFFGANFWSYYLFKTKAFSYLFIILSFTMPFGALYNLCFAVISGVSNYKRATIISFVAYIATTILILLLVVYYQLSGAFLAVVLTPTVQLLILVFFVRNQLFLFLNTKIGFDPFFRGKLFLFMIMAIAAIVLGNVVELQLRNYLIIKLSINEAGYWTSMLTLSNYYLSFMTGVYSLYVLPKYAKIKSFEGFKLELFKIFKFIVPLFCVGFLGLFLFRVSVIKLLFTDAFLPMGILFKWQLLGDLVKIIAITIAYQFMAQNKWKLFIFTEFISYLLFYFLGIYFVNLMGVEGLVLAHFLRYIIYLVFVIFTVKYCFKTKENIDESIY